MSLQYPLSKRVNLVGSITIVDAERDVLATARNEKVADTLVQAANAYRELETLAREVVEWDKAGRPYIFRDIHPMVRLAAALEKAKVTP